MTKTQAISVMILQRISEGKTVQQAIDEVLGTGTFSRIASEVYDGLRK
jgi:hypothetical protein